MEKITELQWDLLKNFGAGTTTEPEYRNVNSEYFKELTDDELRTLHNGLNNFPEIKHNDYSYRENGTWNLVRVRNKNEFIGLDSYPEIKNYIITHEAVHKTSGMSQRVKYCISLIEKEIVRRFFL